VMVMVDPGGRAETLIYCWFTLANRREPYSWERKIASGDYCCRLHDRLILLLLLADAYLGNTSFGVYYRVLCVVC
jgi:hypothetical protein